MDELQRSITDMGDLAPNIIVCGVFNLPSIVWQDGHEPEVTNDRDMFYCISDFMSVNFLQQHITNPTHRDGNTLDLIFTNNSNLIHTYECVIPPLSSVSNHNIVECQSEYLVLLIQMEML